jgi:hypothetical protein
MGENDVHQLLANGINLLGGTGDRTALQMRAILCGEGNCRPSASMCSRQVPVPLLWAEVPGRPTCSVSRPRRGPPRPATAPIRPSRDLSL